MSSYIVFGGCSFIGRNIVSLLVDQDSVEKVVVVDKSRPELSWLTGPHKEAFKSSKITFKQANLSNIDTIHKLFADHPTDFVINCSAQNKYGMSEDVYMASIYQVGVNIANEAAKNSIKKLVQISSGEVYASSKEQNCSSSKIDPWTLSGKAYSKLDKELLARKDLKCYVLRPALVYGHGDLIQLMPRIIVTAVYKLLNETMKLLWTKNLKINTVHAEDVASAAHFCCTHDIPTGVYNLADKSDSTQGKITSILCEIFNIKFDFVGKVESNLARLNMKAVVEDINEKHMVPWSDVCTKENISATPLSPYLDRELLYKHHFSINGDEIEKVGFKYAYPQFHKDTVKKVVDSCIENNIFPKSCLP